METSTEKNDFQFHGLQKTRLFPEGTVFTIGHDAICISSAYQIAIASCGDHKLVSFNSSAIHSLRVSQQTTNKEFTELQKKVVELAAEDKIVSLSVNSDGTLLAVLVNNLSGAFVYIFDMAAFSLKYAGEVYQVAAIRLGAETSAKGVCLKWNPALADTLAASADDRSLVVAKVDQKNPSTYSLVASKTMGAIVTQISWSPKGKQLTTGDSVGKVCQLKLELDVVRGTMPPDFPNTPKEHSSPVIGLCWISTTEWIVAYPGPNADAFVFILTIKKDQQPSWKPLPELQFGNIQSSVGSCFSFDTSLLLAWNLVLVSSAKSSEITVIGKTNDWKIWELDELGRLDLPTNSSTAETFPLGLCVDLSSSTQVVLKNVVRVTPDPARKLRGGSLNKFLGDDGSKTHRPCPIVFVLTTDGIFTAHNVVSMDSSHTDCTIEPANVPTTVNVGKKPVGALSAAKVVPPKPQIATPAPLVIPTMKSVFGGEDPPTPTAVFPPGQSKPSFFASSKTNLFQPQASSTPLKQVAPPTFALSTATFSSPVSTFGSSTSIPPMTATTTPIKPSIDASSIKKETLDDISAEVAAVNRVSAEIRQKWSSLVDDLRAISVGLGHTEAITHETTVAMQSHESRHLTEFNKILAEADLEYRKMEGRIAALIANTGAKHAKVDLYESNEERLRALHNIENFDTDEKMKRLTIKLDSAQEKFGEVKRKFQDCSKMKKKSLKPIPSLTTNERDFIQTQLKVVQKWTSNLKSKMDLIEDDYKMYKMNQGKTTQTLKSNWPLPKINVFQCQPAPSIQGINIQEGRVRLLDFITHQKNEPVKMKKVEPIPFGDYSKEKEVQNPFENLKEALLSSLKSPEKHHNTSLNVSRSDATTQIDAPPQIKIVEKEVPVPRLVQETPHEPVMPPSSLSTSYSASEQKPKTIAGKSTSPLAVKSEEKPIAKPITEAISSGIKVPSITPEPEKKAPLTAKPSVLPDTVKPRTPTDTVTPKAAPSIFDISSMMSSTTAKKPLSPVIEVKQEEKSAEVDKTAGFVLPTENEAKTGAGITSTAAASPAAVTTSSTPPTKPTFSFATPAQNTSAASSTPTKATEVSNFLFNTPTTTAAAPSGETPKPTFSFSGGTKTESPKPNIFTTSSVFSTGSGQTPEKSSIFTGGNSSNVFSQPTEQKQPFGQFTSPAQNATPTSFSFKPKETTQPAPAPAAASFIFNPKPSGVSSGFHAAAKAAAEEGMMEAESGTANTRAAGSSSAFGGFGSMSLGSSTTASNPSKNIFSSSMTNSQPQQKSSFGLFTNTAKNPNAFGNFGGNAAQTGATPSIFGGSQALQASQPTGGGIFGGGTQQPTQTKSAFGSSFGQAAQQVATNTSASTGFNTNVPKFGAAANFGAAKQNVFGGKPVFGNSSASGTGATPGTGTAPVAGGFAKYATSGNLFNAQPQQQQQAQNQGSSFQWR